MHGESFACETRSTAAVTNIIIIIIYKKTSYIISYYYIRAAGRRERKIEKGVGKLSRVPGNRGPRDGASGFACVRAASVTGRRAAAAEVCSMKNRFETLTARRPPPATTSRVRNARARRRPTARSRRRVAKLLRHYTPPAKVRVGRKACKTFRPCALPSRGGPYAA